MSKRIEASKLLRLSVVAASVLMMVGCSHTFRNRNFDYLNQPVDQLPPVQVPQGVTAPALAPTNTLPPGQTQYSAVPMVSMTPPGYSKQYNPKLIPKTTSVASSAASSVTQATSPVAATAKPVSSTPNIQQLQQQVAATEAQLAALKQQAATPAAVSPAKSGSNNTTSAAASTVGATASAATATAGAATGAAAVATAAIPVAASAVTPKSGAPAVASASSTPSTTSTLLSLPPTMRSPEATMTPQITPSAESTTQVVPATVPAGTLLALPTSSAASNAAVSNAGTAQSAATATPVAAHLLPSSTSQDAADVTTLTIQAPSPVVWVALPTALQNSGFDTVSTSQAQGFYYIVPHGDSVQGNTWMLFISGQDNSTNIVLYDPSGALSGSAQANTLIHYIQQHLAGS